MLLGVWLAAPLIASAHPPPMPEDTGTASEMLKKKRKTPFRAIAGDRVSDKQGYGREGCMDIKSMRVVDADPLVVEIELYEAIEPDPAGLLVFLLPEGAMRFKFAAFQPEEGEWGLFRVGASGVFDDPMGSASYYREGTVCTVTIPRADIPLDDFLVHGHVLSGPDNDNLWKDDCPNGRFGLGIPARPESETEN